MQIITKLMTENDCYKANKRLLSVDYLIVHSTATPGVMAESWFSRWNKAGVAKCVHAFVDDKVIMQYLPWDWRGWQIGTLWGNSHSIGCEMCEDKEWTEEYFLNAKRNMVELYAFLADKYKVPVKRIIGHYEAFQLGIGSNHGDPRHWWSKFNYTMDDFRNEVQKEINKMATVLQKGSTGDAVKKLQNDLTKLGYTLEADGIFGAGTESTVKRFQGDHGLVADGIVGEKTLKKIDELLAPIPEQIPTPVPEDPATKWVCAIQLEGITFEQAKAVKATYPQTTIVIQ